MSKNDSRADKKTGLITSAFAAAIGLGIATIQMAPVLDDVEGTTNALKAQGFEPVEVGGGVWLGGEAGDLWRTQFTATNQNGQEIVGYATSGIFKGTTLRDLQVVEGPSLD